MPADTPTPPPAQTPPDVTPEAGTPEAAAQVRAAQAQPPHRGREFVGLFFITALTLAFFLAVFFFFPGLDGGSSDKAADVDSVRARLRAQDSLDGAALARYTAVRDTAGAVRGFTIPIDSAIAREVQPTAPDSVLPLR